MSVHKLSPGDGYRYLTRQVAAQDASVPAGGLGAYYSEKGEAPGVWLGAGLTGLGIESGATVSEAQLTWLIGKGCHPVTGDPLGTPFPGAPATSEFRQLVAARLAAEATACGLSEGEPLPAAMRASVRTDVARELFAREEGRSPVDARELSTFIAQRSRLAPDTVAGYDLTFSPVKSVSALWALAGPDAARQVEAAHHAAIADTMGWLEQTATFTRLGHNGVRQVETRGLIAAAFTHRDSRAGDPDLHTHVAVSNKVQTADGRWRALDGRVLHKAITAASERYNTRLEAHLTARLGVRFADRPGAADRRPVREVVGVDAELIQLWSSRRRVIDVRRADLAATFQAEHGRPPTAYEAIALAQQATLETRQSKHGPRSQVEQRASWAADAVGVLGADGVVQMFEHVNAAAQRRAPAGIAGEDVALIAEQVVRIVEAHRATWQVWHVRAEAERQARAHDVPLGRLDATVEAIVRSALADCSVPVTDPDLVEVPAELRRSDGTSVYRVAGADTYTSTAILRAEQDLLDAVSRHDGQRLDPATVDLALLEAAANGTALNAGQVHLVVQLATSGVRLQLALAPAGTGKTTALNVLARAWADGGGTVLGLAPSAAAAAVLREATGRPADTLAKFLHDLDLDLDHRHDHTPDRGHDLDDGRPQRGALGPGTLVVIDEAGMAGTLDLARAVGAVLEAGGSVRLVGDDRQLAAVGAGGILRDINATAGAVTLDTAVRFSDPAEATSALHLREGNSAGLGHYIDKGRVHVADTAAIVHTAYQAWAADRAAGRDTVLLAATRDLVTALNQHARNERLAHEQPTGEVTLRDGTAASAGDPVITRHNDRRLRLGASDWVKNGDRFTVEQVAEDGSLTVHHLGTGRQIVLPARYVTSHVQLGYASTIHGAQGATADTSHTVLTGQETREQLYVAATRGLHANHLHVALPGAEHDHAPIARDTLIPPTAVELLEQILHRDGAQHSASSQLREHVDPGRQLRQAIVRYTDGVTHAAQPQTAQPQTSGGPLPWLPQIPAHLNEQWRTYLSTRADQITELANRIIDDLPTTEPTSGWELTLDVVDKQLLADISVWRAAHAITDDDSALPAAAVTDAERDHQTTLRVRFYRTLYPEPAQPDSDKPASLHGEPELHRRVQPTPRPVTPARPRYDVPPPCSTPQRQQGGPRR